MLGACYEKKGKARKRVGENFDGPLCPEVMTKDSTEPPNPVIGSAVRNMLPSCESGN